MSKLPDEFVKKVEDDIVKDVLPNLKTMLGNHYPHLEVAYRPEHPEFFLFGYVIGDLEASYHSLFIQDYGLGEYSDHEYFAIHRLITAYKEQIMAIVKEFLKD